MTVKKAKEWNSWGDVQNTFEVETPHQVKMKLLWHWIKAIALAMDESPKTIKAHDRTWKLAEKKQQESLDRLRKFGMQGMDDPTF